MAPILRVRTVTAFVTLKRGGDWEASIAAASSVLGAVKRQLERCGLEVQTTRLATNNFTEFVHVKDENSAVEEAKLVEDICARHDISFVSLGGGCGADLELAASLVGPILSATSNVFLNLQLESFKDCEATSQVIELLQRGADTDDTEAQSHCFRFTACCRCKAGIPFFPAAHWSTGEEVEAPVSFAVGLENSGLLYEALEASAGDLDGVTEAVRSRFETELEPIRRAGDEIAGESGANFLGILKTSGTSAESIVDAFELLVPAFGSSGTLAVAAAVTKGIQSLERSCGYSGLMLPVCEDAGLAKAFSEGRVGITELLCLSSVCGIGIDTLPVPGNLGCKSMSHILADTLALAKRWNKQLSCRLLPCPGKEAGEKTDFRSPYLVDATL
ncbi:DUF711 domain-containing protein [Chloropicon roscoffensis]|uniref:DUF711 domain-containing protein n=1 Tax=Chloropicon roscoffensis TaxID=1461544 RepID=A0AAX4PHB2_9CHLO